MSDDRTNNNTCLIYYMYNIYSINTDFSKFFIFLLIITVICYTALDILLTFLKNNLQNHYISWYKFSHIFILF